MDSLKKYYGVLIFTAVLILLGVIISSTIVPKIKTCSEYKTNIEDAQTKQKTLKEQLSRVQERIQQTKNAIATAQKKVYSPIDSDLGQETLFFTLYNDVVEMIHANSVKIKSIEYSYNPENDEFVQFSKEHNDLYFVCDVDMDLVANYINLGKFIQDIYQYPYYIKINKLEVLPYAKDKKILLTKLSLRLYSHTSANEFAENTETPDEEALKSLPSRN